MKKIGIIVIASLALAAAAQEGFLLRRTLTEGMTDVYSSTVKSKQIVSGTPQGDIEMGFDLTSKMTYKYGKLDEKGLADLAVTVSDIKINMDGPMAGAIGDPPKEYKVLGKVDARNQVTAIKIEGLSAQEQMMMNTAQSMQSLTGVVFPEKAIKTGESWKVRVPKNEAFGIVESEMTATLTGEKTEEGKALYEIKLVGSVPMDMDMSKLMGENNAAGGMKMMMKGKMDTVGTLIVEKSTGRMVVMNMKIKNDSKLDMTDMGMTMDIKGNSDVTVKLQK